jgi:hypothetical protein
VHTSQPPPAPRTAAAEAAAAAAAIAVVEHSNSPTAADVRQQLHQQQQLQQQQAAAPPVLPPRQAVQQQLQPIALPVSSPQQLSQLSVGTAPATPMERFQWGGSSQGDNDDKVTYHKLHLLEQVMLMLMYDVATYLNKYC